MRARYRWIITKDYLNEGLEISDVGREGPHNLNPEVDLSETQFRMYDDDGELYYEGAIFGDFTGFEPLDDFGTPNAGCTEIKLKHGNHWITV